MAGAAAIVLLLGALAVVSGIYNVAATSEHFTVTNRLIDFALRRSIAVRSAAIEAPELDDPQSIRLGSEHFSSGCAPCHGDPAGSQNPIVERMYPGPPPLEHAVADWTSEQLFWIVKHGIKYTGMPAWPGEGRDEEIWPVVAYLNQLGDTPAGESPQAGNRDQTVADVPLTVIGSAGDQSCARCHGDENAPPISGLVPALQGQNAGYLIRALHEYRDGTRPSGMMEPVAAELSADEIESLAQHYASLAMTPARDGETASSSDARRGREIAQRGVPGDGIPPCIACHSGQSSPTFPQIAGLSVRYIKSQLDLWRRGYRQQTTYGAIMATIAQRLSQEQIDDVAAYFASLSRGAGVERAHGDAVTDE